MKPVRHPSNTRTLGAPVGWDQSGLPVESLGITDTVIGGVPCVLSFWQPDAVDLVNIAAGRPVGLSIVGRTMPPAALVTFDPEPADRPATEPAVAVQAETVAPASADNKCPQCGELVSFDGNNAPYCAYIGCLWNNEESRDLDAPAARCQPEPFAQRAAIVDVQAERARQDAQWGGPSHDDQHDPVDWARFIEDQAYWGREQDPRRRFIKIAALAVAAIESIDRKAGGAR